MFFLFQDPAGIFELVEVVGNGTYGQVYKVRQMQDKRKRDSGVFLGVNAILLLLSNNRWLLKL